MYAVYRKISNGYYRRLFVTDDVFYANEYATHSDNCHVETVKVL